MAQRTCSIEGCEAARRKREWCEKHYARWLRHGDPLGVAARPTVAERFWPKVDLGGDGGCWLWAASLDGCGYGRIRVDGKLDMAHRVAWELHRGPVPDGLEIDHLCRVRNCVNPDHMEPVTRRENTLRGTSPVAVAAMQTHCVNGHEFSPENTYVRRRKGRTHTTRVCRACDKAAGDRWRQRRRDARAS